MTIQEKIHKIKTAEDDIKTIEGLLEQFDSQKANQVVNQTMSNLDYFAAIVAGRSTYKLPVGNIPYNNLKFVDKIKVLRMLLDAVKVTLVTLSATQTQDED